MAHLPIDSHALRASSILPPGLATVHLDSFQPCPWTYFLRFAGLFGAEYSLWLLGLYFSAFYPFRTFLRWLFTAAIQTSTGVSHGFNRAGLWLRWCFPTRISKPHTALHRTSCGFVSQNEVAPPPKGGGAGYRLSWVGRVGSVRSKLAHTPPTGRVCCFDGVVLLPSHLTGHKSPHRAEFGFHRFFLVCFFRGNPANWRSRW